MVLLSWGCCLSIYMCVSTCVFQTGLEGVASSACACVLLLVVAEQNGKLHMYATACFWVVA